MIASLYRLFFSVLLGMFTPIAMAGENMVFKQPFSPKNGWLTYGLAMIMLLIIAFILTKKYKPGSTKIPLCKLIEKKYLGNKTVVYIIDYQQQRFLLADNQQALALHQVVQEATDEQA